MKESNFTLNKVQEGKSATVKELLAMGSMRRRLQDIGFVEGTHVVCLQKSPSGDPTAYLVRGAVIALRSETSREIVIESCS